MRSVRRSPSSLPTPARSLRRAGPLLLATTLLAAGLLSACGGGDGGTPTGSGGSGGGPTIASLAIGAAPDSLAELDERQLAVTATASDGKAVSSPAVTWTSSDTTILTVSAQGNVRGVRPGTATVRATSGSASADRSIRVVAARVLGVRIRGADSVVVGTTATVTGEPTDPIGRPLLGRTVTFTIADTTVARVTGNVVRGVALGRTQIVATTGGVSESRALIVRGPYAASLAFVRVPDTLFTSVRDSVRAAFTDSAGRLVTDGRPITYTSDSPAVVVFEANGVIRPVAVGTTTIRASGDRLVATRTVTVLQAPVSRIVVAPDTITVRQGQTAQALPILFDLGGVRTYRRAVRYATASTGTATVNATGLVRGVAEGVTTLTTTSERGTSTNVVRVVSATPTFNIDLRFVGASAPQFEEAFRFAKIQWGQAILAGGAPISTTIAVGTCGNPGPAVAETIRDVVIFVRLDNIDGRGGILGSAGPCLIRTASGLPLVGTMTFDTNDLRPLFANQTLQATVTHEMGHVLGVGTIWNSNGRMLAANSGGTGDPRFFGRRAIRASAALGFQTLDEGVPLEDLGGQGTRGGHWNEAIFMNELMTGFINAGTNPMSLLTIESLGDLGYDVATSAAEPFGRMLEAPLTGVAALAERLPSVLPAVRAAGVAPHAELVLPVGTVGPDGRVRPSRIDR